MNTAVGIPAAQGVFIDNRWRPAASGRTLPIALYDIAALKTLVFKLGSGNAPAP
jgi:hypothetical protein